MTFRNSIFWCHLLAGLTAGVVIAMMSTTGIAVAFEEEILRWHDRRVSHLVDVPERGNAPLSILELTHEVEANHVGEKVSSIAMFRDPERAWEVHLGDDGPFYLNPFTGSTQASLAHGAHQVIHKLEEWHRWLGDEDGQNSIGSLVTGVSNLALAVLCVTGLYLWFPQRWSWRAVRSLLLLKTRFRGKPRDLNWHQVVGLWSLPVVLTLSLTAVVISFEWGHRLVFALAGEEAPKSRNYGMMAVPAPVVSLPVVGASPVSFDGCFARIGAAFPNWESITLEVIPHLAASPLEPLKFGVTLPDSMPSRAYVPVRCDPFTGEILQQTHFQDRSPDLQARVWNRFLHTGAAFGLPGKIVATLAAAASLVLIWTGFALSWRRFFRKSPLRAV